MNRFRSFLIAAAAIVATALVLTVRDPHAVTTMPEPGVEIPEPAPVAASAPVEAPAPPPAPPSWFELKPGSELSFILTGTVPSEETKSALLASTRSAAPELVKLHEKIEVNPAVASPPWIAALPDLIGTLVAGVQEPELRIERALARVGGISGDKEALSEIRGRFEALFADHAKREDGLRYDVARPTPETRMPLVLYLGPLEGKYSFEGSLPTAGQRKAVREAAVAAVGEARFADHLRVSPATVDEAWLAILPDFIQGLLDEKNGAMELIIVDRTVTLKGDVPDEAAKKKLLELLAPAREAGYAVVDGMNVKG